ncbi:DsbA family protein [Turneriella parva]|uniref:DSBA oxidoreductase n=1 Tax=Turneriella parva (strain ATCC BAA-1111 / DSM 21527 / NCTC 11395 / H) TaxID=869212 RepID=I4B788_TURPD|nr:DsbA family protein [Turneriella parva]AFM13145.1 DSBA oxidoreductase [Turneriella parva DSM 21527]
MAGLRRLYYFADPMCSWCYGFAPVFDRLRAAYARDLDIRLVMGGLRPGTLAEPMTPARARLMRQHWREVAKMTGQPFEDDIFKRDDFVYDTEPAAKAVIVMERLAPEHAYDYYHEIQRGFYAHSQDITSAEVLANFARRFGVSATDFAAAFTGEEAHKETWGQFTFSASLGVKGFPALVLEEDGQFMLVMRGYQPFEEISVTLAKVLKGAAGHNEGDACDVGGEC